ncbi:hypothetical protein [Nocardioides speluncae]|uniref:hypothetical protein n=1 Tax=Nocardioides speluncae TaxID=2670337 RepID=UPI000D69954C|nr:hypothetical protein [Nocardioides speluncae]
MAGRLVKVVHENGRVGYVAETYPPLVAGLLRVAPSEEAAINLPPDEQPVDPGDPEDEQPADEPNDKAPPPPERPDPLPDPVVPDTPTRKRNTKSKED